MERGAVFVLAAGVGASTAAKEAKSAIVGTGPGGWPGRPRAQRRTPQAAAAARRGAAWAGKTTRRRRTFQARAQRGTARPFYIAPIVRRSGQWAARPIAHNRTALCNRAAIAPFRGMGGSNDGRAKRAPALTRRAKATRGPRAPAEPGAALAG